MRFSNSEGSFDDEPGGIPFSSSLLCCNFGSQDTLLLHNSVDLTAKGLNQLDFSLVLIQFALDSLDELSRVIQLFFLLLASKHRQLEEKSLNDCFCPFQLGWPLVCLHYEKDSFEAPDEDLGVICLAKAHALKNQLGCTIGEKIRTLLEKMVNTYWLCARTRLNT